MSCCRPATTKYLLALSPAAVTFFVWLSIFIRTLQLTAWNWSAILTPRLHHRPSNQSWSGGAATSPEPSSTATVSSHHSSGYHQYLYYMCLHWICHFRTKNLYPIYNTNTTLWICYHIDVERWFRILQLTAVVIVLSLEFLFRFLVSVLDLFWQ